MSDYEDDRYQDGYDAGFDVGYDEGYETAERVERQTITALENRITDAISYLQQALDETCWEDVKAALRTLRDAERFF